MFLALNSGEQLQRSLAILDQIPYQETMKIGVVYVSPEQVEESDIRNNTIGSIHYHCVCIDETLEDYDSVSDRWWKVWVNIWF